MTVKMVDIGRMDVRVAMMVIFTSLVGVVRMQANVGRDFYLAIPFTKLFFSRRQPILYFASRLDGNVRVESPANDQMNKTVALNKKQTTKFELSIYTADSNIVSNAGIYLHSDTDITVSMFFEASRTTYDAALFVLPIPALSTQYTVPSGKPHDTSMQFSSEIVVVGTQPSTTVALTFPAHITDAKNARFTLDRLDTYFYRGSVDLSGAQVTSDKPIAVISATGAAVVPSATSGGAESIAEFIPPDDFAAYNFLVPALPGRRNYTVKLLPIEQNTIICLQNKSSSINATLHRDKIVEFTFGNECVGIHSSKPVFVYQYAFSIANDVDGNGAFMRYIPAVESYVTESYFVAQGIRREAQNIVQVIAPVGDKVEVDNMDIDTVPDVSVSCVTRFVVDGRAYDVKNFNVSAGYHIIRGGSFAFGALIHGYVPGNRFGYGHTLGLRKPDRSTTTTTVIVTTSTNLPTPRMTSNIADSSTIARSASKTASETERSSYLPWFYVLAGYAALITTMFIIVTVVLCRRTNQVRRTPDKQRHTANGMEMGTVTETSNVPRDGSGRPTERYQSLLDQPSPSECYENVTSTYDQRVDNQEEELYEDVD